VGIAEHSLVVCSMTLIISNKVGAKIMSRLSLMSNEGLCESSCRMLHGPFGVLLIA
jgi:hypothetical protein